MKRTSGYVKKYFMIFAGCFLLACAYNLAYDPNSMVPGGVSGLGIVIKSLTEKIYPGGVPLWMSTFALNIPIYIAAFLSRGRRFVLNSVVGTVMLTVCLYLIPVHDIAAGDRILACIFGAASCGIGTGLVLMAQASTGGTDMLGMALSRFFPGIPVANMVGIIDGAVVIVGAIVFGITPTLYAVLSVFITTKVTDLIITGQRNAQMFYCISDKNEEIAADIMGTVSRGVSEVRIRGMYTGAGKSMLLCVASRRETVQLRRIIKSHDPGAFVIISSVSDVRGEGFIEDILEN